MKKREIKGIEKMLTWYKADEVLPKKSGDDFLIIDIVGVITTTSYSHEHKAFNASDGNPPIHQFNDVVYWADLKQIKEYFHKKLYAELWQCNE